MQEQLPATLLVLVPLLPLAGAILTVLLGRRLGPRAHLPAMAGIGAAALVAIALLGATARDVGSTHGPVEVIAPLWQWASIEGAEPDTDAGDTAATRGLSIPVTLRLDPLTATMLTIITCVGLLVAIYSTGYMHGDPGYPRFFALVAMFVFSMSMLVMASNFLLVYVFWEAVGACSYLLIGFWFTKPEAAKAAKKAFLVNRVGDFGLAVATFLIWMSFGTLDFHDTLTPQNVIVPGVLGQTRLADPGGYALPGAAGFSGAAVGTAICLLLLLAACGKSAQLPLHVWLPDAMEGPTPASALIHAATMVTAGIYLVARTAPLFIAHPGALTLVSIVGATTALVAALIGTVQNDLKRVLAYSTISQLGYMFASLGTGTLLGFTAAIFHLLTHACFKALLFLGAGSVMHSMGGVIDMRRFGGLRRVMPITAATFLVGAAALAGVAPFAGFFSKDEILAALHAKAWPDAHGSHAEHHERAPDGRAAAVRPFRLAALRSDHAPAAGHDALTLVAPGSPGRDRALALDALDTPSIWQVLFWMSLVTAGLTAFYTFRAVFMTFTGPTRLPEGAGHGHDGDHGHGRHNEHGHDHRHDHDHGSLESPPAMTLPLVVLAVASAGIGWLLFATNWLTHFLAATPSLAASAVARTAVPHVFHWDLAIQGTLSAVVGIVLAAIGHLGRRSDGPQMERFLGPLGTLFANKFYFDQIYAWCVVRPLEFLAALAAMFDRTVVDGAVDAVGGIPGAIGGVLRRSQSGLLQRYALAGVLGVLSIVVLLAWQLRG
jgi:NADH-quinone oxidoreductase subunit L